MCVASVVDGVDFSVNTTQTTVQTGECFLMNISMKQVASYTLSKSPELIIV